MGEFAFWACFAWTDTTVTSFLVYNSIHRPDVGPFLESKSIIVLYPVVDFPIAASPRHWTLIRKSRWFPQRTCITMASPSAIPIHALVNYEDPYVQPLLLRALSARLPPTSYKLVTALEDLPPSTPCLQFVQYESISWDLLLSNSSFLANAYVIRKALIRKHYLSTTVANWITKYPDSVLKRGVKPSVEFEVDYAEFLDDALVEAWELRESWGRSEGKEGEEREWWILKPGMSERGQGIRLFSSEEELTAIFEEWD